MHARTQTLVYYLSARLRVTVKEIGFSYKGISAALALYAKTDMLLFYFWSGSFVINDLAQHRDHRINTSH